MLKSLRKAQARVRDSLREAEAEKEQEKVKKRKKNHLEPAENQDSVPSAKRNEKLQEETKPKQATKQKQHSSTATLDDIFKPENAPALDAKQVWPSEIGVALNLVL